METKLKRHYTSNRPQQIRVAANRNSVVACVVTFGFIAIVFAASAVYAIATGQTAAAVGSACVCFLFAVGAQRVLTAELYANETWVGRTSPWPKRVRRSDLAAIRYAGPFISPAWEFVGHDGNVAFRVSPVLFGRDAVSRFTNMLGYHLQA